MPKNTKKEEDTLQNPEKTIFTDDKFELLMERDEFFTKEERELLFSLYKNYCVSPEKPYKKEIAES